MHLNCHMCGGEKQQNWYFNLCEPHKKDYREKKKQEKFSKRCQNGNHDWQTSFYGGIEKKKCSRCNKTKMPSYMNTVFEHKTNSFSLSEKMESVAKRFPRKYRRFEEYYYSGRVANIIYWLRYEKNWTAQKIENTFNISKQVLDSLIIRYTWKKGDKYLSDR